jgi:hypothetical protein
MSLQQLGRERFEVCHKRKPLNVQRHQANMIAWWRRPLNRKLQFFSSQRCVRGLPQVSREPFCGWRVLEMCRPPRHKFGKTSPASASPYAGAFSLALRRRDDRISFCRDQKTLLKKAQRLTRRNQRGISTDGFTLLGADRLQCRMKAITYLIIREFHQLTPVGPKSFRSFLGTTS